MTQSIDLSTKTNIAFHQPNVLVINSPNNEKLLEITNDGDVFFRLNSELTGFSYKDKNELVIKIIKNYRENKIGNILA
jgi:hypothetical protein